MYVDAHDRQQVTLADDGYFDVVTERLRAALGIAVRTTLIF